MAEPDRVTVYPLCHFEGAAGRAPGGFKARFPGARGGMLYQITFSAN